MENYSICKTSREVVEELIQEYLHQKSKVNEVEEAGFNPDLLLNWAFDIIGFPKDTSMDEYGSEDFFFLRDYLTDSTLITGEAGAVQHSNLTEYVDSLFVDLEKLKVEAPQLFQ